jgi:hypothetical protein
MEINLTHVCLLHVIFVTKCFVEHVSYLLSCFQVVMSQHMGELNDCLTTITNDFGKELPFLIGDDLYHWGKYQAEKNINHWNGRESCTRSAQESTSFVMKVLASKSYLVYVDWIKLKSEIVD